MACRRAVFRPIPAQANVSGRVAWQSEAPPCTPLGSSGMPAPAAWACHPPAMLSRDHSQYTATFPDGPLENVASGAPAGRGGFETSRCVTSATGGGRYRIRQRADGSAYRPRRRLSVTPSIRGLNPSQRRCSKYRAGSRPSPPFFPGSATPRPLPTPEREPRVWCPWLRSARTA